MILVRNLIKKVKGSSRKTVAQIVIQHRNVQKFWLNDIDFDVDESCNLTKRFRKESNISPRNLTSITK